MNDSFIYMEENEVSCKMKRTPGTKCESLDFVEASYRNRIYPVIYCKITLNGQLDPDRLKRAVLNSCQYVPEILFSFNFFRNSFVDKGFSADHAILFTQSQIPFSECWNLKKDTQLKLFVQQFGDQCLITVGMSHILTDGAGFLQYLYLLCALYNDIPLPIHLKNNRQITPLLRDICIQPPTEQTLYGQKTNIPPLRPKNRGTRYYCLHKTICPSSLCAIREKAKKHGVTLNDILITAYSRVLAGLQHIDKIIVPCPADLRRFHPSFGNFPEMLSVANMTGNYRRLTIETSPSHCFEDTLLQVHLEMELQKSAFRCFSGIPKLEQAYKKLPHILLSPLIKFTYPLLPVSYTNFGIIDDEKLVFYGCSIKECYLTGAYRIPPDFQLSVSTFQNMCTLNCTLIGDASDKAIGETILTQVQQELLKWSRT